MFEQSAELFDARASIRRLGLDNARMAARTAMERSCVDAAAEMDEAKPSYMNPVIGSWVVSCLPYRQTGNGLCYKRTLGGACHTLSCDGNFEGSLASGIPFGAKARIILLHLINVAARSGSSTVDVRGSQAAWISAMHTPLGGMSYRHITDMSRRIQLTRLRIQNESTGFDLGVHGFVERLEYGSTSQNNNFPTAVILDHGFYRHAMANTVLLDRKALGLVANNGWAIDLYIWLRVMCPPPGQMQHVTWESLYVGFNSGKSPFRRIKARLIETLPLAMAICPGVSISASQNGLAIRTSKCTSFPTLS